MTYDPRKGTQKCTNLTAIQALSNPQQDDKAIAQDTGIEYQYRNGTWVTANNIFTTPCQFGNWIPVQIIPVNAQTLNTTITGLNGDLDSRYRIVVDVKNVGASDCLIYALANASATSAYQGQRILGGPGVTIGADTWGNSNGYVLAACGAGYYVSATAELSAKTNSDRACYTRFCYQQSSSVYPQQLHTTRWTDNVTNITSLTFICAVAITGTITLYKWNEQFKPIDLATYELIKEYNLNGSTAVDDTIPINGDVDDELRIITNSQLNATGTGLLTLGINGDLTAASYVRSYIGADGAALSAGSDSGMPGIQIGYSSPAIEMCAYTTVNLKSGSYKKARVEAIQYNSGNVDNTLSDQNIYYKSTGVVTSIRIKTDTIYFKGTVKIYKLAKAQLVSTNPNLLTIWSKYVDANTIQVQPGEIEINGTICQVTTPTNVALSTNLKSGLTETPSTYYYLYAVRNSSNPRYVTWMFDTVAPTMDRYGQTVTGFDQCDFSKAWFHPTLGFNYRYVGQVFNDSSSNILPFDKMKPGYWEGAWTSFSWTVSAAQTLSHALGKIPTKLILLLKYSNSDTSFYEAGYYFNGSSNYGILSNFDSTGSYPTVSTFSIWQQGSNGIYYHNSAWQKTGYYKLIFKD